MCSKQAPVFLHRFICMLQFFGLIYFNRHLKTNGLRKIYFILRTLCQWIILAFSTYTFYGNYFTRHLNTEDIAVVVLWVATIIHFLISTVVITRGQKMVIYIFSEMSRIIEHCLEIPSFKLCQFFEILINILTAIVLIFAYVVATISRPTDFITQAVYTNNVLTNYINILVEEIILMYIFFVNTVIRNISKRMAMPNLKVEDVKCFRSVYRDLCILSMYVNENFGIIITSCVTFSQLQCWIDMLMFIRISYESEVDNVGNVMFIVATFYHIFLTYLLCWFCEDIENQVSIKHFLLEQFTMKVIILQENKIKSQIHQIEDDCESEQLQDQVTNKNKNNKCSTNYLSFCSCTVFAFS